MLLSVTVMLVLFAPIISIVVLAAFWPSVLEVDIFTIKPPRLSWPFVACLAIIGGLSLNYVQIHSQVTQCIEPDVVEIVKEIPVEVRVEVEKIVKVKVPYKPKCRDHAVPLDRRKGVQHCENGARFNTTSNGRMYCKCPVKSKT